MMKQKFYCTECNSIVNNLVEYYGSLLCPICEHEIFKSKEELKEYLDYSDTVQKLPFNKSNKMKLNIVRK